jgi:secondary thiamine-phosphate synthase enzyme
VQPLLSQISTPKLGVRSEVLYHQTKEPLQFLDLTDEIAACVGRSGVDHGVVNIHSRHTTAAIVVNEHESLLLGDLKERLERFAPAGAGYQHDDFEIRTENLTPDERPNGHSHVQALVLPCGVSLNLVEGELQLGRWQRIFLAELDGGRMREISVLVMGVGHFAGGA